MVLVSGAGTTLENLCSKCRSKKMDAEITCVISNRANLPAADVARKWRVPYWTLDPKIYPPKEHWDRVFGEIVEVYDPGLIILAGFTQLLNIPIGYSERVLNIHPSLLPSYGGKGMYGDNVYKAVLASDDTETGCSVHVCNGEYDRGTVIGTQRVPIELEDTVETLKKRVQIAERQLFPSIIDKYLTKLKMSNRYS